VNRHRQELTAMDLTPDAMERYDRQLTLAGFGARGQEMLSAASVLVVGAGGLGSPAIRYLAGAGVGRIGILDSDSVDLSNLHRQTLYTMADIGAPKALAAAAVVAAVNPDSRAEPMVVRIDESSAPGIVAAWDVVIDASDTFDTRYVVSDACWRAGVTVVEAGIGGYFGQLLTIVPGPDAACYRCVFPDTPAPAPGSRKPGVLGPVAGAIGCLQAVEAIKLIIGHGETLAGRMLFGDFATFDMTVAEVSPRPDCTLCGTPGDASPC
jgi:molybdopterin/thiamine biosynthesis adenylyltransferase